ncbi:hypothetical protein NE865_05553 [Phthorimaea operculella]|nr:hypothetical protein NE865_05553 [Phthorimaea operculella]
MTSPRRTKKYSGQCVIPNADWDSPSAATGTVKRRRSSFPENVKLSFGSQDAVFEVQTPSDSGSGTSNDKTDSLVDVEQRISSIINESRSSRSNSETSDVDIIIDNVLNNPDDDDLFRTDNVTFPCDRGKTFIKSQEKSEISTRCDSKPEETSPSKKVKERRLKAPIPIKKLNKSLDIVKNTRLTSPKETPKLEDKSSLLPVYKSTLQGSVDLSANSPKKKPTSKLRLPFSPVIAMDKPKINFFQNKSNTQDGKPSPLLSSPVRRTISNEYVRLKFTNDTVIRRTIDGKSVPKITPKIQSIIPESPVDSEDPFLNLSPNKKYTVTVNNKVRCDKDNYVIFDPQTGFKPEDAAKQSRIPLKSPSGEKSRIPLKSPSERTGAVRKSANVSDTDSGILSPNSPVETSASERASAYYANAAAFSEAARKTATDLDITILDPGLAKKAAEQIKLGHVYRMEPSRLPRRVLLGAVANAKRGVGRPMLRFKDCAKRDMAAFDIDHQSLLRIGMNGESVCLMGLKLTMMPGSLVSQTKGKNDI